MTKTTSLSFRLASTLIHSSSLKFAPKLCVATHKSTPDRSLIDRSALRNGASRLEPTYRTVTFMRRSLSVRVGRRSRAAFRALPHQDSNNHDRALPADAWPATLMNADSIHA